MRTSTTPSGRSWMSAVRSPTIAAIYSIKSARMRWDRERWNRWLRQWGLWTAVCLALAGWWMAPLWSAKILPLHDLPNHLALISAYHYLPDARWNLQPFYERAMGPMPYVAHYLTVHLLAFLTNSVVRANLIFMSLYV